MKVLILDDSETRLAIFRLRFADDQVVTVKTAEDAINLLSEHKFDRVYLDHDLGEKQTGFDVADYVKMLDDAQRPELVVVHSHNHYRARQMANMLADAGIQAYLEPFTVSSSEQVKLHLHDFFTESSSSSSGP